MTLGPQTFLGIEGGGTRTVALLVNDRGEALQRLEAGPANVKLLTDVELTRHFRSLAAVLPRPAALAIGLAGAWTAVDRKRIRVAADKIWPGVPCYATNDLETAITAAAIGAPNPRTRVLIVSGTGSCCYG